jgi:hypothetical protein
VEDETGGDALTAGESITVQVVDALNACGLAYLLAGSFSSNYYGIPRSTKDADFVVQLTAALGEDFAARLGDRVILDPQLSFETNTGTYRQMLRFKRSAFKVELFMLSSDAHDQTRFQRRVEVALLGRQLWLPTAEDVIITKLRWWRNKDRDDITNVIAVQAGKLDWPYIEQWCDCHGTRALLEEIRRTVPRI